MWRSLTKKVFAVCDPSVPAPCSPQTFSFIFQCLPGIFVQDRGTWVKIWWWSTCALTIYYLLLLILMLCTFLCDYFFCIPSLLLSLQMQISSGFLLIYFQLIKCLWGRREPGVWSVSFKHTLHAARNFTLLFTVTPITNGSEEKRWFYFEKMEKRLFSIFSENWKKQKGFVINIEELKKSPSYSYLYAAKFTE